MGVLPECLESLRRQTFRDFELIVVDNGSTDGSIAALNRDYPEVRLLELPKNLGYSVANNRGLEMAHGDYIVALNNDTRAEADWLEKLVAAADACPEAGMVGSRTVVYETPELVDTLGGRVCRDGMSRGAFRHRRFDDLGLSGVIPILYPSPCAALYRRQMLEQIGFFDEDFFAYAEDTDLGLRGRWAGWDAVLATDAVVRHHYSVTGGSFSPFKLYLVERNHYWVALKNFPWSMLLQLPFWSIVRLWMQIVAVRQGVGSGGEFAQSGQCWPIIKALIKANIDALWGVPGMLKKRRRFHSQRRRTSGEMATLLQQFRLSFAELLDLHVAASPNGDSSDRERLN